MAMKRCSECGEKYSDTYKRCPFCEEEQRISKGKRVQPKRPKGSGRGAKGAPSDKENALTLVLIVIMLVLAGILLWLLFGGGGDKNPGGSSSSSEISSGSTSGGTSAGTSSGATSSGTGSSSGTSSMPEVIVPELPLVDKVKQLPNTLTLNKTDFTEPVGNTVQLKVGSGGGVYSWVSEDESIATVDSTGKVTMVGAGTTNVYATDGEHMGKCIVRVKAGSGGTTQQPTTDPDPTPSTSSAKISRTDMTIKVGATWRLKITGYDGTVTWKTNNAGIATVSEDGVVRGISSGNTTVTATVGDRTLKCIVRVKN